MTHGLLLKKFGNVFTGNSGDFFITACCAVHFSENMNTQHSQCK